MSRVGVGIVAVALLVTPAGAAAADTKDPKPTEAEFSASVVPIENTVTAFEMGRSVEKLDTEKSDGAEKVLTLNSDILFTFDKAAIAPGAVSKIGELVKGLPPKAKVSVGGHTDSLGTDARNLALSQQRAQAVAAAIRAARPDLVLTVKGFGKSQPVASNGSPGKDDPEGRAKNRRVEIRYAG